MQPQPIDLLALPADLLHCPITGKLLVDPVITPQGTTYSRAAIELWINTNKTDPISGKALQITNLRKDKFTTDLLTGLERAQDKDKHPVLLVQKAQLQTPNAKFYNCPVVEGQGQISEAKSADLPYSHLLAKQLTATVIKAESIAQTRAAADQKEGGDEAEGAPNAAADEKAGDPGAAAGDAKEGAPAAEALSDLTKAQHLWLREHSNDPALADAKDAKNVPVVAAYKTSDFTCSIGLDPLTNDAVITPTGHAYNRKAIETWLNGDAKREMKSHNRCPMSKQPLKIADLRPLKIPHQFKTPPRYARDVNGDLLLVTHPKLFVIDATGLIAEATDQKDAQQRYQYRLFNHLVGTDVPFLPRAAAAADESVRAPLAQGPAEALLGPLAPVAGEGPGDMKEPLLLADGGDEGIAHDLGRLRELLQEARMEAARALRQAEHASARAARAEARAVEVQASAAAERASHKCCYNWTLTGSALIIVGGAIYLGVAQPWKHNGSYTPLPPTPVDPSLSYTLTVLGQNYNQFCILAQGGNQALRVGAYQFTLMDEQPIEILQPSTGVSLFPIGSQFTPPAQNSDGGFSATIILPSAGVTLSDGQQGCIRMNTALYNNSVNIGGLIPLNAPVFVNGISIPISGFNPNTTDPTPGIATLSDYTTWGGTTPPQSTFVHRTNTVVYRDMIFDVNGTITANTYDAPAQFRTLQSQNPNANGRFLAFLGGYGTGDTTAQIANATANAFATNIQAMVHHGFDGLVFDPDVVGAKTPITGAQLVSMATTIASRVPQLTIIVPGSEYGLSRLQPLGAWCDAAAPYNVRLVRATNFAWGTGANGKSMTDDQTALRMNPANPTADRTSSFTDSTSRLRQLCPTLNPRKFGGTVYTDGVATTVDPTNWGPEGNGRYAFAVKDVGDQGFVQLKDLAGGNFPFTNLQCTWTGDNPDYSNVTQTPYCFTPIGNIYVTFTDAQSARLIAKAAQANGHGSISISSSSGQAGDAPLGRGYSIADAVYGVFNPANATASAATPQPSAQPQAAATVDSVAESKSVAVSVPAIPADLSNQLVTAISQGALHSVASTLGRETVVATLQKRGYTEEDARAISTQWNYLLNAAILLACGASLGTALAVPTLITVLEALGVKSEKASGLASALIATVNVCNAKYTMVEMLSQWGISGAMLKNFAVLGVNTACSVAASIFTSRAGRPIINALATAADKIISNPIVQYCANSKAAAAVQYAGSAVSYGFFGVGKALGKSAVLVVDVAQGGYGLLCSAAGMFRSKPVGAPVPASALKHVTVVPTQKM